MNETLQVIVVTLVAAGALLMLVRSYLPGRDKPSRPANGAGCSNCASNATAPARQTRPAPKP